MNSIEPLVIQVSPIHDVEGTCLEDQLIEDIDVVDTGRCHDHHVWNVPAQIQQGVKLDSALGSSELCPWEQRKAKIDGCGVQRIRSLDQVDTQAFPEKKILSAFDEDLREISEDPPVSAFVGVGKGAPGDLVAEPSVIQFPLHGTQACDDVPQTLSIGQLSEDHDHELGIATEASDAPIPSISMDTLVEFVSRQEIQDLRKYKPPLVHVSTPDQLSGVGQSAGGISSVEIEKSTRPWFCLY